MKILTQEGAFQEVDELGYFRWRASSWPRGYFRAGGLETTSMKAPGTERVVLGLIPVARGTLVCFWHAQNDLYWLGVDTTNPSDTIRCRSLEDAEVALIALEIAMQAGEAIPKPRRQALN